MLRVASGKIPFHCNRFKAQGPTAMLLHNQPTLITGPGPVVMVLSAFLLVVAPPASQDVNGMEENISHRSGPCQCSVVSCRLAFGLVLAIQAVHPVQWTIMWSTRNVTLLKLPAIILKSESNCSPTECGRREKYFGWIFLIENCLTKHSENFDELKT